jgi:hypothetical protein
MSTKTAIGGMSGDDWVKVAFQVATVYAGYKALVWLIGRFS